MPYSSNDENEDLLLQDFWKDLGYGLKVKPTGDGTEDVFSEYRGLPAIFIETDAAENAEHGELLKRAIAIRDSDGALP